MALAVGVSSIIIVVRIGGFRWQRTAPICTAERGRKFTFETIDDRTQHHETRWQYTMEQSGSGTVVTESFQFLWCSRRNRATEMFLPRGRQANRGIDETLRRIKHAAEALHAAGSS
jgi:hypothetical protein